MPEKTNASTEKNSRKPRVLRLAGWLMTTSDELTIGPRVPARVRVLWGILVLIALVWIIVLVHQQATDNASLRTLIIETRSQR